MESLISELDRLPEHRTLGRVAGIQGLLVQVGAGVESVGAD